MSKRLLIAFSIVAFQTVMAIAQSKRGNIGIFGDGVTLDFNSTPPSVYPVPDISSISFNTNEGSASICNNEGELLFYTNGVSVWNREHLFMPHNIGLSGNDWSLTTSQIIIVPIPKDPFQYYIITPGKQGKAITYALIDMRLNKGMGDVVFENKLLYEKSTEKATIVKHSSNQSVWLITHEYGTDAFRSFFIDEDGLHTDYVESTVGVVHLENTEIFDPNVHGIYGTNAIGYLKPSHDGKFLACAVDGEMGTLELFKFDNATGEVLAPIKLLDDKIQGSYGVEFSSDNTKLYASCNKNKNLYQFDLSSGNPTTILNSKTLISSSVDGALQLAPDNKIYCVPSSNLTFLNRINNPNAGGADCSYEIDAINLDPKTVWLGLPEFVYNTVDPEVIYEGYCTNLPTTFHLINIKDFESIQWNFGDSESGSKNISWDISPSHVYSSPGYHKIKARITFADNSVFNYSQRISVFPAPNVSLGKDTTLCSSNVLFLHPQTDPIPLEYKWNDGSNNASLEAPNSGIYWVEVNDGMCVAYDTIEVIVDTFPEIHLKDTTLCLGQSLSVTLPSTFQYTWNDGDHHSERILNSPGKYSVRGTNKCGIKEAKSIVAFLPKLNVNFPADTLLCFGQILLLNATNPQAEYRWQDTSTEPTYTISTSGKYWVQVFHRCETVSDTIEVEHLSQWNYFVPNVITPNGDGLNDYFTIPMCARIQALPYLIVGVNSFTHPLVTKINGTVMTFQLALIIIYLRIDVLRKKQRVG